MKIRLYIVVAIFIILFSSCKNEAKQDVTSFEIAVNNDSLAVVDTSTQLYPGWIAEFQILRQALYQNDFETVSTFFEFPLTEEQSDGLSAAIYFNTNKELSKTVKLNSKIVVEKYYTQVFPVSFVKGLLSIKSDSLVANNLASSKDWKLPNDNASYHATVTYDGYDKSVSLLLNAVYGTEGGSDEESETESATVFIFKLDKNNKLKFDRVIMAG